MNNIFCKKSFFRNVLFSCLFCLGFVNIDTQASVYSEFYLTRFKDDRGSTLGGFLDADGGLNLVDCERFFASTLGTKSFNFNAVNLLFSCDEFDHYVNKGFWGFNVVLDWYEVFADGDIDVDENQISLLMLILFKYKYPINQNQIDRAKRLGISNSLIECFRNYFVIHSSLPISRQDIVSRLLNRLPTDFYLVNFLFARGAYVLGTQGFDLMLNWYEFSTESFRVKRRQLMKISSVLLEGRFPINQNQVDRAKRLGVPDFIIKRHIGDCLAHSKWYFDLLK